MQTQWKINKKIPKQFIESFPEYTELTLQLLWDRNLKTQQDIDEFFNPDYNQDLHDPFLMKGMKKAVSRIEKAIKSKEKITIFGDYDADGVCSTAILSETLNVLKSKPSVYIPNRNKEGYGLNLQAVKEAIDKGTTLIITVDCGMSDFEEIKLANSLGVDVIIVDHHELSGKLPEAFSIVNPRQSGETYPFLELAAAGVVFKLCQALLSRTSTIIDGWEKWLLDLVAIATVSDCMLLIGENRTLVRYGLVVLAKTKRIGLQMLMNKVNIKSIVDNQLSMTSLDSYVLGFIFGPRINAAGRMGNAIMAYELLVSKTKEEAEKLAKELDKKNRERIKITNKIFEEVDKRIKTEDNIIFEGDESWPVGVVGLIAGRLTEKYLRPTIIFQKEESKSTGSARSIDGFNIVAAISECKELLEDFGGHPGAAGFTVLNKNLDEFKKKLFTIASKKIKKENLGLVIKIDKEMTLKEIDFKTFEEIQKFSPFGEGNSRPLFTMKDLKVMSLRRVGSDNNHLKLSLSREGKTLEAIGFWLGDFYDKIKKDDSLEIVFELDVNEWNGTRELQLKIKDLRRSK